MRIKTLYQSRTTVYDRQASTVVIGRPKLGAPVDIDLTPDELSSRPHARISWEGGQWWIEDLGSRRGTKIDGREIKGLGKTSLSTENVIRIGATVLRLEPLGGSTADGQVHGNSSETWRPPEETTDSGASHRPTLSRASRTVRPLPAQRAAAQPEEAFTFSLVVPAAEPVGLPAAAGINAAAAARQRVLYDLLLEFGADAPLDHILQHALAGLVASIPAAQRGAVLLVQPKSNKLLLKAHLPPGQPAVSETLAERAMARREGFVWEREQELSVSLIEFAMASGMYAPMVWKGETFGVIGVDNSTNSQRFETEDLQLLVAAAQHAALAIANHQLRAELQSNAQLTERLLTNFSPAVRQRLLEKARSGRLRLGGEKSEVTILSSDIRGFTRISAKMEAEEVVDMLNCYFSVLVDAIFRHGGTVDKFIGDAILAVFGSPEPDPDQHANAVCAAVAMQAALAEVNATRKARGQAVCEMGIGVHCGPVLHGFIGSEDRMEFTVIGDTVNRTARYCDGAKAGQVLVSPEVYQRVWKMVRTESITIPTKHEGDLPAFCVLECKSKQTPAPDAAD